MLLSCHYVSRFSSATLFSIFSRFADTMLLTIFSVLITPLRVMFSCHVCAILFAFAFMLLLFT